MAANGEGGTGRELASIVAARTWVYWAAGGVEGVGTVASRWWPKDSAEKGWPIILGEPCNEGGGESSIWSIGDAAGPVKIHRSLTRERLVREIDVRREKECASSEARRVRMWLSESVANVSSWYPATSKWKSTTRLEMGARGTHICSL